MVCSALHKRVDRLVNLRHVCEGRIGAELTIASDRAELAAMAAACERRMGFLY